MKKRIHREFVLVALATIILTTVLVTAVFYEFFRKEIMDELGTCTRMLQSIGVSDILDDTDETSEHLNIQGLRISLIGKDGDVLYDNGADVGDMKNHGDRPEVVRAREEGSGQAVRRSDTLDQSSFYYAILLEDVTVLLNET